MIMAYKNLKGYPPIGNKQFTGKSTTPKYRYMVCTDMFIIIKVHSVTHIGCKQ